MVVLPGVKYLEQGSVGYNPGVVEHFGTTAVGYVGTVTAGDRRHAYMPFSGPLAVEAKKKPKKRAEHRKG